MSFFVPPPLPANPPGSPPADLVEYMYFSQYGTDQIGLQISPNGVPTNVDGNIMNLTAYSLPLPGTTGTTTSAWTASATAGATGVYTYNLTSSNTSGVGYYRIDWSFTLSSVPEVVSTYIEVGPFSPAYMQLEGHGRQIVNDVWAKLGDGYDSPTGGPNLQMWYQTHFHRGRLAQLLRQAIQHINVAAQPPNTYSADGTDGPLFPYFQWKGLVNSALTVEVIKHLMRSYVEEPEIQGAVQSRMIRRDYLSRWQVMLDIEQKEYKEQRDVWKISQMFRMTPRVLVAGGAYGNYSPVRMIGNTVARPIYWWRFY